MGVTPLNLFYALWVVGGIWMDFKLLWMVIYQIRYGGNAGELYITGRFVKNDYRKTRDTKSSQQGIEHKTN